MNDSQKIVREIYQNKVQILIYPFIVFTSSESTIFSEEEETLEILKNEDFPQNNSKTVLQDGEGSIKVIIPPGSPKNTTLLRQYLWSEGINPSALSKMELRGISDLLKKIPGILRSKTPSAYYTFDELFPLTGVEQYLRKYFILYPHNFVTTNNKRYVRIYLKNISAAVMEYPLNQFKNQDFPLSLNQSYPWISKKILAKEQISRYPNYDNSKCTYENPQCVSVLPIGVDGKFHSFPRRLFGPNFFQWDLKPKGENVTKKIQITREIYTNNFEVLKIPFNFFRANLWSSGLKNREIKIYHLEEDYLGAKENSLSLTNNQEVIVKGIASETEPLSLWRMCSHELKGSNSSFFIQESRSMSNLIQSIPELLLRFNPETGRSISLKNLLKSYVNSYEEFKNRTYLFDDCDLSPSNVHQNDYGGLEIMINIDELSFYSIPIQSFVTDETLKQIKNDSGGGYPFFGIPDIDSKISCKKNSTERALNVLPGGVWPKAYSAPSYLFSILSWLFPTWTKQFYLNWFNDLIPDIDSLGTKKIFSSPIPNPVEDTDGAKGGFCKKPQVRWYLQCPNKDYKPKEVQNGRTSQDDQKQEEVQNEGISQEVPREDKSVSSYIPFMVGGGLILLIGIIVYTFIYSTNDKKKDSEKILEGGDSDEKKEDINDEKVINREQGFPSNRKKVKSKKRRSQ